MEEKFKAGLANQVMEEFDNVRKLREDFITSGARSKHIETLDEVLNKLFAIYLDLTKPAE